jgi:hypothetical protein
MQKTKVRETRPGAEAVPFRGWQAQVPVTQIVTLIRLP